jgi:UDPglucose 6-dehydrogenase
MKTVIIGQGFVGKATALTLNQEVDWHDPPKGLSTDYKSADIVFVCCFDDLIDHYLEELKDHPCVIVRSTLIPSKVQNKNFAVYPEFLVEARWEHDALNPIQIVFGGSDQQFQKLKSITKLDLSKIVVTKPEIASLMKVTTNAFLSMKVIFLNALHQACSKDNINYNEFKEVLKIDTRMGDTHFDVPGPDSKFGFGGKCFPKDSKWLQTYFDFIGVDSDLMYHVLRLNDEVRNER